VAVCIVDIGSDCPQIFIYNDLHPNRSQDEAVASKMVFLVKKLRAESVGDVLLQRNTRSVWVPHQRSLSNECWSSTILNMGIVAASGEAEGPFEYKPASRFCLRECLVAIAEWQRREKNDSVNAIPQNLIEAFRSCILGAVARVEVEAESGERKVATVEEPKQEELVVQPSVVDGEESEQKRAKICVAATEQGKPDVGTEQSEGEVEIEEPKQKQPPVGQQLVDNVAKAGKPQEQQDGKESEQKRAKTDSSEDMSGFNSLDDVVEDWREFVFPYKLN
jgi:hypothetical protein